MNKIIFFNMFIDFRLSLSKIGIAIRKSKVGSLLSIKGTVTTIKIIT